MHPGGASPWHWTSLSEPRGKSEPHICFASRCWTRKTFCWSVSWCGNLVCCGHPGQIKHLWCFPLSCWLPAAVEKSLINTGFQRQRPGPPLNRSHPAVAAAWRRQMHRHVQPGRPFGSLQVQSDIMLFKRGSWTKWSSHFASKLTQGSFAWSAIKYDRSHSFPLSFSCFSSAPFSGSVVSNSATPWTAARQASQSITTSRSPPKPMSIESVTPSSHLILCRPLLLLPPIPPSIRVFSSESAPRIRWPKYWSFSFSISPSNEHPGLISFRMDCLDVLAVQGLSVASVVSSSLRPHGLQPTRLLCPWDSPGKNTGVGCHSLPQGNLPDPGIGPKSPASPSSAGEFFPTEPPGKPSCVLPLGNVRIKRYWRESCS